MAIQTWTTGQTLLASQLTALNANDYNWTVNAQTASYVLVAADAGKHVTMSNAGATTITVNTGLFTAGDTLRITNINATGTCTITAGTCTVATAGSLILSAYTSGILWFQAAGVAYFFPDAKTSLAGVGNFVSTSQTTASTSYADLTTAGSVTITTGTSALVTVSCNASTATAGASLYMGFAVSGATTTAASDTYSAFYRNSSNYTTALSATFPVTLTAGSNTFTTKFRTDAGTATFQSRTIAVISL